MAERGVDDAELGFQYREDAEQFLEQLRERLRKFGFELHPDKTRLIEFGRFAAERRRGAEKGSRKPLTTSAGGATGQVASRYIARRSANAWGQS